MEHMHKDSLYDLLHLIMMGEQGEDLVLDAGNRLNRLEKEMTAPEKEKFKEISGGKTIYWFIQEWRDAFNPDILEREAAVALTEGIFSLREVNGQNFIVGPDSYTFEPDGIVYGPPGITHVDKVYADQIKKLAWNEVQELRIKQVAGTLSVPLIDYIIKVWQSRGQADESKNTNTAVYAGRDGNEKENAEVLVKDFTDYINTQKDSIPALGIYYNQRIQNP